VRIGVIQEYPHDGSESQVDAGRLDRSIVKRLDSKAPGGDDLA